MESENAPKLGTKCIASTELLIYEFLVYILLDSSQNNRCHYDFLSALCTCTNI